MKKTTLFIGVFSLLFTGFVFAKPVLPIQHWQTRSGARVLFVKAPQIPMLDVAVMFKAGSVYDGQQAGLATLANAMLNEGAGKLNADQLAERFDAVGANFGNAVGKELAFVSVRSLTKAAYLKAALNTLQVILSKPTWPQQNITRIKKQMLVGLQAAEQQPSYVAGRRFARLIWGKHPYANPSNGTAKSIPLLTKAKLQKFYRRYYVARNATIILVGDISLAKAKRIANQLVEKLPRGKKAAPIAAVPFNKARIEHIDFPASQTSVLIGEVGVQRNDKDYLALSVGNDILGGSSLNSILMSTVREKYGLTYGIYSAFEALTERGAFVISLKSRNDQADKAIKITQRELAQFIQKGPTAAQLTAAKSYLLGSFPLAIASNASVLQNLVSIAAYQLPLNYLDTYRGKVEALTRQDIKRAFKKAIQQKRLVIVTVGGKA